MLFEFGIGSRVVGVTEYCVHPADQVADLPKIGGTKNANAASILELAPDLVIANKEENRPALVAAMEEAGVPILVTDARSVERAVAEIALLGRATACESEAAGLVMRINRELERLSDLVDRPRVPVVTLIWKGPYMVVGGDTYADDLLARCGASNPFAGAEGRYPRVREGDLEASAPEVILLPSEPYAFGEQDRLELLGLECPASRSSQVYLVEGELLSWYGPRIVRALRELPALVAPNP